MTVRYSFIVPVYNRPQEVDELLQSLCGQTFKDFEVVIVEDGSSLPCNKVVETYSGLLDIRYFAKENSGPGQTRNYGVERAEGVFVLILDSDVVLPPTYLEEVDRALGEEDCDAFGGPDRAHESFTSVQKAISYAMTSFFTTGGIRGGKKKLDKFYPRSFNMGVRRTVYRTLKGFSTMRFGEDIDFSIRLFQHNYRVRLLPEAWVWHKRRTNFRQFFKQVHNSGIARIHLTKRHPGTLKPVHMLPALFTIGCALLLLAGIITPWAWTLLAVYALVVCCDASVRTKSPYVGLLSVMAAFVQLTGYGTGFLRAWWQRYVLGNKEFEAFRETFYD